MSKERLLAELEDLLRTAPPRDTLKQDTAENIAWLGRASAVVHLWNLPNVALFRMYLDELHDLNFINSGNGYRNLMTMLHQARHELRMETVGPVNVAVQRGMVFDYFDEVRKILETANQDLLFVDPYLDAEFVSRYLSHVRSGVEIRLLGREKLATLLPAVDAFVNQTNSTIKVRSAAGFHDRYAFVDGTCCYQSASSFKDGARSSPTTLTQITDAFAAVRQIYEDLWNGARVER